MSRHGYDPHEPLLPYLLVPVIYVGIMSLIVYLMFSCAPQRRISEQVHVVPPTSESDTCPEIIREGRKWEPVDEREIAGAIQGCTRIFGPGACVIRMIKRRDHVFHVICRRATE